MPSLLYRYRLCINRIIFRFNESVQFNQLVMVLYCDGVHNIKDFELQYSNSSDGPWTLLSRWTASNDSNEHYCWQYFDIDTDINEYENYSFWKL